MTPTKYYNQKSKISSSKKLTERQKETQKFNLWIDFIFNSVRTAKNN